MQTHQEQTDHEQTHQEQTHPSVKQYVTIAVVLAVLTAIEVGIYYVEALKGILVPALLVLAVVKFALVVLWFMHLKFESRLFMRLFVTGLVLALTLFAVVLATFFARR